MGHDPTDVGGMISDSEGAFNDLLNADPGPIIRLKSIREAALFQNDDQCITILASQSADTPDGNSNFQS
jgi:hypothetical protein